MPQTAENGTVETPDKKESLELAVAHAIRAEEIGVSGKVLLRLYDHASVALNELRFGEIGEATNRDYRNDAITILEKQYDHYFRLSLGGDGITDDKKLSEYAAELNVTSFELADAYYDAAQDLSRQLENHTYKPEQGIKEPEEEVKPSAGLNIENVLSSIEETGGSTLRESEDQPKPVPDIELLVDYAESPEETTTGYKLRTYSPGDITNNPPKPEFTMSDAVAKSIEYLTHDGWEDKNTGIQALRGIATGQRTSADAEPNRQAIFERLNAYAALRAIHAELCREHFGKYVMQHQQE